MVLWKKASSRRKNWGVTRRGAPFFSLGRRGRFSLILSLALAGAAVVALAAQPYLRGWSRPPDEARLAARRAVDDARGVDARRWAPQLLEEAELAMKSAVGEERRQYARLLPRRDFRAVLQGFVDAEQLAGKAHEEALRQMALTEVQAGEALDRAKQRLDDAESVELLMPITPGERALLNRARIKLHESRVLYEGLEYAQAARCAESCRSNADAMIRQALPRTLRYTAREQVETWLAWIEETITWSRKNKKPALIVYKEKNLVALYDKGSFARGFKGDMGWNTVSAKLSAGDGATPEGRYLIKAKKGVGQSEYYKALLINYPNDEDKKRFNAAIRAKQISRKAKLGGLIEIHGHGGSDEDWTRGCIALANEDMDTLYSIVEVGTPVTIVGGDGEQGIFSDFSRHQRGLGGKEAP